MSKCKASSAGFTIVEMAIVFLVITILLGGGLVAFQAQTEQQRIADTKKVLEDARQALIGYAASKTPPYFPCPDQVAGAGANDGLENRASATTCTGSYEGNLPWKDLGIDGRDAWGNRIHYRVAQDFISQATGIQLTVDPSALQVMTIYNENGPALAVNQLATNLPVVLLSYGSNGLGATSGNGSQIPSASAGANEAENTDLDRDFVIAPITSETAATRGIYDDLVVWLPTPMIRSRLIDAGKY